ncbi:hypothetical protein JYU34_019258 [Plutella xylostella]|uniref:Dendritic cell-specific transmembrane protein-like domain-containing protein n=1 Tax=Plutella xylostella TaxID=51655 RepID=A0ABQ7PWE0_PLUXY|nr:hypothetical protein JYU34_019258 [Plutella xylostella]
MAHFAMLWKARNLERYRRKYEKEKMISITLAKTVAPRKSLFQRIETCFQYNVKRQMKQAYNKLFPEGSSFSEFLIYLRTDQTFPNFVLKSVLGFVGGIVLTYLCFMFFVFQLAISLMHATIMSSIIGVLLTLGLAFSYRVRCLVFLLIPQLFSRVGRYTLTCYALVLILTGPATNTLKNSEVLSESMACTQEQLKTSVNQISESMKKPFNSMKDTIKVIIERVKHVTFNMKETLLKVHRLAMCTVRSLQSSFFWLDTVVQECNKKLGTPYDRCMNALEMGVLNCKKKFGSSADAHLCSITYVVKPVCGTFKPLKAICVFVDFFKGTIVATVQKKLQSFANHVKTMLFVSVSMHHSYSYSCNFSRSASQVAAGIVTEIRGRADPLLTWLSWSSCVTSLFLLLIIFRAKYYQHMYEVRSRFDNRYITKDLRELDLKRAKQDRETVLPLNRREKAKYVTTTSFRLVASEKLYLTRSVVFMTITTFKLLIHIVADYSLYWVLTTIRYHGRFQTPINPGQTEGGIQIIGKGPVAGIMRAIVDAISIPIATPGPSPVSCLPNPYPPDLQRYAQIGVLIFLIWFFALFEPYGLRLRHIIMGLYRPERAKQRAVWLHNHILEARCSFIKYARRKLHREYKYYSERRFTIRSRLECMLPYPWLLHLLGIKRKYPQCLLCDTTEYQNEPDTYLTICDHAGCPGVYCAICYNAIGRLCTICLTPADYGDLSDVSFEKGSSDENSCSDQDSDHESELPHCSRKCAARHSPVEADDSCSSSPTPKHSKTKRRKFKYCSKKGHTNKAIDEIELLRFDRAASNRALRKDYYFYISETAGKKTDKVKFNKFYK